MGCVARQYFSERRALGVQRVPREFIISKQLALILQRSGLHQVHKDASPMEIGRQS